MKETSITQEQYTSHRNIATQVESMYQEINKLATKKPADQITALISRKINHLIVKVKDSVKNDEFLDAIETIPVEGTLLRLDEALITLAELKSIMDKQWGSEEYVYYRKYRGIHHENQIIR
jgi:uncharacterized FlaG/YvyC family protein